MHAEDWEPIELGGVVVGEVHMLRADDGDRPYEAGLWRVRDERPPAFRYAFERDETIHVIEGAVEIAVDDGPVLTLRAGELASFAAGASATWRVVETPFLEAFVLA